MSGITESGELELGVLVDDVAHRTFVMRPATLADSYRALEVVELPEGVQDDPRLKTAYQVAVADAEILSQLVKLGELEPAPQIEALVAEIAPDDMAILRTAADRLKKKLLESRRNSAVSASPSLPSSGPDSP